MSSRTSRASAFTPSSLIVRFAEHTGWEIVWPKAAEVLACINYQPSEGQIEDWISHLAHVDEWRAWCGWKFDPSVSTHRLDLTTLVFLVSMERRETLFYPLLSAQHQRLVPATNFGGDLTRIQGTRELLQRFEVDALEAAERTAYLAIRKEPPTSPKVRQVARAASILRLIRRIMYSCERSPPDIPVTFTNGQGDQVNAQDILQIANSTHSLDESFVDRFREALFGVHLQLGERIVYASTNPVPLDDSLTASSLAKPELTPEQVKAITREEEAKARTEDQHEVALLLRFGYWFQNHSPKRTDFIDKYVILWHQWCTDREFELLISHKRNERDRLPIICHAGRNCWLLFGRDFCLVYEDVIAAIFAWYYLTTDETYASRGEDEFGAAIPSPTRRTRTRL